MGDQIARLQHATNVGWDRQVQDQISAARNYPSDYEVGKYPAIRPSNPLFLRSQAHNCIARKRVEFNWQAAESIC